MSCPGSSLRRVGTVLASLALVAVGGMQAATSAPKPTPVTTPGGLRPGQALPATTCNGAGVCIVKATTGPSCTGYSSQSVPPANIRVLVHTSPVQVKTIPFRTYVANVLPNEWVPSWDGDALKAGAVAVKSYAWYWTIHYGGYLNTPANCFDVTDDQAFQVYRAGSSTLRTDVAVQKSWNVAARMSGRVIQASYRAYLDSPTEACGAFANGAILSQWGTQNCVEANTGNKYNVILQRYYFPGLQLATAAQRTTSPFSKPAPARCSARPPQFGRSTTATPPSSASACEATSRPLPTPATGSPRSACSGHRPAVGTKPARQAGWR